MTSALEETDNFASPDGIFGLGVAGKQKRVTKGGRSSVDWPTADFKFSKVTLSSTASLEYSDGNVRVGNTGAPEAKSIAESGDRLS